jgi:hypothetical protein
MESEQKTDVRGSASCEPILVPLQMMALSHHCVTVRAEARDRKGGMMPVEMKNQKIKNNIHA